MKHAFFICKDTKKILLLHDFYEKGISLHSRYNRDADLGRVGNSRESGIGVISAIDISADAIYVGGAVDVRYRTDR